MGAFNVKIKRPAAHLRLRHPRPRDAAPNLRSGPGWLVVAYSHLTGAQSQTACNRGNPRPKAPVTNHGPPQPGCPATRRPPTLLPAQLDAQRQGRATARDVGQCEPANNELRPRHFRPHPVPHGTTPKPDQRYRATDKRTKPCAPVQSSNQRALRPPTNRLAFRFLA